MEKRQFKLSESHVKKITLQLIMGVQYLHSFGIIHRDLKLENIVMSNDSDNACPKLADFGLASILGPSETASESYGTVGYASPEVLKKESYSFSCDTWSLGCILYAMISGHLPFASRNDQEVRRQTI